jgi:uncharacterized protein
MPYTIADELEALRQKIPQMRCIVGCQDCCGPVTASAEEVSRLPVKSDAEHAKALSEFSCPYLGDSGCEVYHQRPLICRLYGTTPSMLCPNGQRPRYMIDEGTEAEVHRFIRRTRQVLL